MKDFEKRMRRNKEKYIETYKERNPELKTSRKVAPPLDFSFQNSNMELALIELRLKIIEIQIKSLLKSEALKLKDREILVKALSKAEESRKNLNKYITKELSKELNKMISKVENVIKELREEISI